MNSRYDENRTRSANEPVIKAGVMIANLSWNIAKTISGIVAAQRRVGRLAHAVEHEERQRVADRPRPMLSPNARLKPTTTQTRLMTPSATTLWSIVETTFLKLTMPP